MDESGDSIEKRLLLEEAKHRSPLKSAIAFAVVTFTLCGAYWFIFNVAHH